MDAKTKYLIKTLSRTKKKDTENFVINAIWNRVGNINLKPVTQQYVYNSKDKVYYFLDLYFPQLNIGVEVDEPHHLNQQERDFKRERAVYYELSKLSLDSSKAPLILRVNTADKTFKEINNRINEVAKTISLKSEELDYKGWFSDPRKYFLNKDKITTSDDIHFRTIKDACNILFNTNYLGQQHSWFQPPMWHNHKLLKNYKLWFPKLAIEVDGKVMAAVKGWNNQLKKDGSIISFDEKDSAIVNKEDCEIIGDSEPLMIVFAKSKDPLGTNAYRFIGIYKQIKYIAMEHDGEYRKANYSEKISNSCNLTKSNNDLANITELFEK